MANEKQNLVVGANFVEARICQILDIDIDDIMQLIPGENNPINCKLEGV